LACAASFLYTVDRFSTALREELQQAYFSAFVEQTWDAIGILDESGRVKLWNHGAEVLFRWKREDVMGKHIKDFLVPSELHEEIDGLLDDIKVNRVTHQRFNSVRCTGTGQRIPVDVSISPIMDPDFRGYFGIMRKAVPPPFADFRYYSPSELSRFPSDYVFVAMPFATEVLPKEVWTTGIRKAIEANGLMAIRADYQSLTDRVMNQIFNDIRHSTLVVVDLTGSNPNVFYELGIAHMLGKPVIQLLADSAHIPFDVADIRTLMYRSSAPEELRDRLTTTIKEHLPFVIKP
jgi:PAS domain S-box-containing protein